METFGTRRRHAARDEPRARLLLGDRVRQLRRRRGAARLRLPAAGDGRADVGHRRAGRAAAEGRHRGRRPRLRAAGRQRHPGRARRARAHRPRPPRRGLADGLRAHVPAQPGHGVGRRRRERPPPRQPPPEHRPLRDLRDRRPAARDRGRQRAHLRAAVRGARAARAGRRRALRLQRGAGRRTPTNSPTAFEAVLRTRDRRALACVLREAKVPGRPDQRGRRGVRARRGTRHGARRGRRRAPADPPAAARSTASARRSAGRRRAWTSTAATCGAGFRTSRRGRGGDRGRGRGRGRGRDRRGRAA